MNFATGDPRIIHARAVKRPNTNRLTFIFNNLITLYAKSNFLSYALAIFHHHIPNPNVVSWTAIISATATTTATQHNLFISMLRHPTLPNHRTLATLFKSCSHSLFFGLQLHTLSLKLSLFSDPYAASGLLNFYCKNRLTVEARKVFDEIPHRDEVCYATIIVGLAQNSKPVEALSYFDEMRRNCCCDDDGGGGRGSGSTMYSISGALRAAAELAALERCQVIHGHSVTIGLDRNVVVRTALIDGYGKCGLVVDARAVFDGLGTEMNVIGWNALMSGYAQFGDKDSVMELFGAMRRQSSGSIVPDGYTFLAILTAFCNAGLASETERWLGKMRLDHGLEPWLEHYSCLVGALGRSGRLDDAEKVAMTLPFEPDAAVWRTLLSSCVYHGNADMAWKMAKKLLELNPDDDSAYVIAANAFAGVGRWDEVKEVRKLMKDRRVRKEGGKSWIEVQGKVHLFFAGDRKHGRTEAIYSKIRDLLEKIEKLGYVPSLNEVLHEVEERNKREALWFHSEKLALAFGLVSGAAPPGKALRIVKNLRICRDCHEFFKYTSIVVEREIIVRDVNRYHKFLNGTCTCGDFW